MGFLSRLLRRALGPKLPGLLRATISGDDRHRYWVTWTKIHPECRDPEYIRLVAHYYAKTLFNCGAKNDELGRSAPVCLHFMRTLLRHTNIGEAKDILTLADVGDTVTLISGAGERQRWSTEATLYFVSVAQRHIATDLPPTAQHMVFSVFVLVQSALTHLSDPHDRQVLERVLRNMQAAYDGGVTWADLTNLALVPTRAVNDAILG